jgi:hypothetical protein
MMKTSCLSVFLILFLAQIASSFRIPNIKIGYDTKNSLKVSVKMEEMQINLKKTLLSLAIVPLLLASTSNIAHAAEVAPQQTYYWGVGCFWHTQHEFVNAEKRILGRSDEQLTSRAGYAGGNRLGKDTNRPGGKGLACYHNMMNVADYGQLGHGEVVGMDIPSSEVKGFADEYFSLFGKDSERPDKVRIRVKVTVNFMVRVGNSKPNSNPNFNTNLNSFYDLYDYKRGIAEGSTAV